MQDDDEDHGGSAEADSARRMRDAQTQKSESSNHRDHEADGRSLSSGADNAGDAHSARIADEMSDEEWLEALLELNPWARGLQIAEASEEFASARRDACQDRWSGGQVHWNSWALEILKLGKQAPSSKPTRRRLLEIAATADFSNRHFVKGHRPFDELIFPGITNFDDAHFDYIASFADAQFNSKAFFTSTHFEQDCAFFRAKFVGRAAFLRAQFNDGALFSSAKFHREATFGGAVFNGRANFNFARFRKSLTFEDWAHSGADRYAKFSKEAYFRCAAFEETASFDGVIFSERANFTSIRSKLGFSLSKAKFAHTPDFTDATFHEPPRLDECVIEQTPDPYGLFADKPAADPRPPSLLFDMYRRDFNIARDGDEHARLRKLRAMAADAKDHENELKFNGYEIAARRFWVDHPYKNPGRFWLGWFYGLTSNYGQSVARPLVAWVGLVGIFWMILFVFTPDHTRTDHGTLCHEQYLRAIGNETSKLRFSGPALQALFLSLRNASVIGQMDPSASRRMYGCLYGLEDMNGQGVASSNGGDAARPGPWPVIPPSVTVLTAIQSVLSAVLLFLTGLGLRNTFRLK